MNIQTSIFNFMRDFHQKNDNDIAVVRGTRKMKYGEFFGEIDRVAAGLFALGVRRGDVVMMLVSDGSCPEVWKKVERFVTPGKYLYFSHGFGYVYSKLTGVRPQKGVGVEGRLQGHKDNLLLLLPLFLHRSSKGDRI